MKLTNPTFNDEDLKILIPEMRKTWNVLRDKVQTRRRHFHSEQEADPKLFPPYDKGRKFQSDAPRRLHSEVKARLTENHSVVKVNPARDTAAQRSDADALEIVLNSGLLLLEERLRLSIQGALADGLIIDYAGWIHWNKATEIYPDIEEDYLEELPEDPDEAARYEADGKGYRETSKSYMDRRNHARAKAGFPWYVCCPDPISITAIPDESMANGFAVVCVESAVFLPEYVRKLREEREEETLSAYDADSDIPIHRIVAPDDEMPSSTDYGTKVRVHQVWTRDEFYEVVEGARKQWAVTKSFRHPHKMPPFAIAPASEINSPDPARRWEPWLEGVYRLKPAFDKRMALLEIVSETIATPLFYLARIKGAEGMPDFNEDGDTVFLTRNMLASKKVPDGYEIRQLETQLNPAFIQGSEMLGAEYKESFPSTGQAEIDSNTKPTTAVLALQNANAVPKVLLNHITIAIQTMVRNMAMVMSLPVEDGGTGEVVVFSWDKETGVIDTTTTVSVEPEKIRSLDVSVTVQPVSASERLMREQHGVELFEKGVISEPVLVEDYMGKENANSWIMAKKVYQLFTKQVEPALMKQEIVKMYGDKIYLGPATGQGSGMYGPDGQPIEPQQGLQANGWQPATPPAGPNVPMLGGAPGPIMPQLPPAAVPV